jgi:hypothetical protein
MTHPDRKLPAFSAVGHPEKAVRFQHVHDGVPELVHV